MEPLSERDDEDHTESQYEHSESENVSEMNDSLHGITVKTGVVLPASSIDGISLRTAATASADDSMCSEGSSSGENHRSPSLKSHLSNIHQPVKIGMDGTLESIPSDD
jgi:hypothetical protein